MKLVFRKNDKEEITVIQSYDGSERNFIYSDMINVLLKDGKLEAPVVEGDFTAEEISSINNMVIEINKETQKTLKVSACAGAPASLTVTNGST